MKILLLLFSLFFSVGSYAQLKSDTVSTRFKNVVFVVDRKRVSREEANKVDVFSKVVVVEPDKNAYVNSPIDTLYVISTKQAAISKYQIKLSKYSIEYKSYLYTHNHTDTDFLYILNGIPLKKDSVLNKLTALSDKKIKTVHFIEEYHKGILNNEQPFVVITTKK